MLLSKFFLPELRPNRVNRLCLLDRLRQATNCQLVIISAPAGYGKTTLASEWVQSASFNTVWISLDESDNDPVRFWTSLVTAVDRLFPGASKNSQNILAARQPAFHQVLLTALLNDLLLQHDRKVDPQSTCLVLDDTHLVTDPTIYEGLLYLVEHLPHNMLLALIGRSDPPLPIGRLRASCRVLEIRAADLRFSLEESEDFLNRVMGFALSPERVKQLEERTEGWIAGLQLAGLAMQGLSIGQHFGDIDTFIENFSGDDRYILDYLVEEVLSRLPAEMQTFLLQTSKLDRMCGPLCDAMIGLRTGESQVMLERLERDNLFLIPLDNCRKWYRYHHLFADLLRHQPERLEAEVTEELAADELHRRAASWLAGQDLLPDAIVQALKGRDFGHAAEWMEAYAVDAIDRGEYTTLKNWIEALPQTVLYSRPELLMHYAWILRYLGDMTQYEPPLLAAEKLWREQGNLARLGEVFNLRSDVAAAFGDGASAANFAEQALTLLQEDNWYHRGMSWLYIGENARLQGDMEKAEQAFSTGKTLCERSGNIAWARMGIISLAQVRQAQGKLPDGARLLEEVLAQTGSLPIYEGMMARMLMSMIWREWNRLEEAEQAVRGVLEIVENTGQVIYFSPCYLNLALILWEKGDPAGMQAALEQYARLAEQIQDPVGQNQGSALRAQLAILSGDLETAKAWRESNPLLIEKSIRYQEEPVSLALSRLLARLGAEEAGQALEFLEKLQSCAQAQGRIASLIETRMLKAITLAALKDTVGAAGALEESLKLAQCGGYRRLYLDEGQPLHDLLRLLVQKPALSPELRAYAMQLLTVAQDVQNINPQNDTRLPNLKLIEPLTPREIEVLRLIQTGLSNREIAEKLYLTINTVKVHAKNIFAKLDVTSRTQAVHRAQELGLI